MNKLAWVLAVSMLSGCNPAMDELQPRDFSFAGMNTSVSAAMDARARSKSKRRGAPKHAGPRRRTGSTETQASHAGALDSCAACDLSLIHI